MLAGEILKQQNICNFDITTIIEDGKILLSQYLSQYGNSGPIDSDIDKITSIALQNGNYKNVENIITSFENAGPNKLVCVSKNIPEYCKIVEPKINLDNLNLFVNMYHPLMTRTYKLFLDYLNESYSVCNKDKNKIKQIQNILKVLGSVVNPSYHKYYLGVISCLVCIICFLFVMCVVLLLNKN